MAVSLASHAPVAPMALSEQRAVLVVAHPGHELRVHGWLELARPTVCILTDGSGHQAAFAAYALAGAAMDTPFPELQ